MNSNEFDEMATVKYELDKIYKWMIDDNFVGEITYEDNLIVWTLPMGIIVKMSINFPPYEGYIDTIFYYGKKEIELTHWHPEIEEVYKDLSDINTGEIFWIIKKHSIFEKLPIIVERRDWENLNDKKKRKYSIYYCADDGKGFIN